MATDYEQFVIDLAPVAYYPCNEDSGNLIDAIGTRDLADPGSGRTYGITADVPVPLVKAISFTFARFSNSSEVQFDTDWSMLLWVKTGTGTGLRFIAQNGENFSSAFVGFGLARDGTSNKFVMYVDDGNGQASQSDTTADDTWVCIVLMGDGASNTMYVNGVSKATSTRQATDSTLGLVELGNFTGNVASENMFDGQACHFAIWDRVLTADEIADLYDYGVNGVPQPSADTGGGGVDCAALVAAVL